MNRFFLFTCFTVAGLWTASAQSFTITPNDTLVVTAPADHLSIFDIYQVNNTSQPLSLTWESVYVDIPEGWDYSLCDLGTCYPGIPAGATMSEVEVGGLGFLGVNVQPFYIPGVAVVQINVFETSNPSSKYTLTWIIDANLTGMAEADPLNVEIFPSITTDVLNIRLNSEKPAEIVIMNSLTHVISSLDAKSNNIQVNVSDFAPDVYHILIFQNGNLARAERFIKL